MLNRYRAAQTCDCHVPRSGTVLRILPNSNGMPRLLERSSPHIDNCLLHYSPIVSAFSLPCSKGYEATQECVHTLFIIY
ncbi:hypothetical protein XELAEV_18026421mg [Xenopus laevis]|uniref:Uncharacterized protein n=1 Tax=Xenopus laevis TaxID=8355 RepID=A0A974CTR9_XENLA|nr:hypothetical protein XELAEV_18026421mg [Xenopus laevis]